MGGEKRGKKPELFLHLESQALSCDSITLEPFTHCPNLFGLKRSTKGTEDRFPHTEEM